MGALPDGLLVKDSRGSRLNRLYSMFYTGLAVILELVGKGPQVECEKLTFSIKYNKHGRYQWFSLFLLSLSKFFLYNHVLLDAESSSQ